MPAPFSNIGAVLAARRYNLSHSRVRLLMPHRKWLIWAAIFGLISIFLRVMHELGEAVPGQSQLLQFDNSVTEIFVAARTPTLNEWALDVTALGSSFLITGFVLFLIAFFSLRKHWGDAFQIALAGIASAILSPILKNFVARERPPIALRLVEVSHYSYPSGHAMASSIIYLTVGLIFFERYQRRAERLLCFGTAGFLILLIGLSRIYLGVHYLTDVLGGFCVGISVALSAFAIRRMYHHKLGIPNYDFKS